MKYSTVLPKSLKKRLQVHAAQQEMDDCDVVAAALRMYLDSHED